MSDENQAVALAATSAPQDMATQTSGEPRRYLVSFFVTGLCVSVLVGVGNYWLDPLSYDKSYHAKVAGIFDQGRNFAIHDPNLDFRGLRREHIRSMKSTPEVILFAGSRFQEATVDTLPRTDVSFYNAFVHNDYYEDYLALSQLLIETGRLPKVLVLSVRYKSFFPLAVRDTEEWKMFAPEYRTMADSLGVPKVAWADSFPFKYWMSIVSVPALVRNIERSFQHRAAPPGETSEAALDVYDVLRADGSLAFSKKHLQTWTVESARADATKRAKQTRDTPLEVDPQRVEGFTRLLDELARRGTHVVIAMTPHHPLYWNGIADAPYGQSLARLERDVYSLGQAHGATVVGSFNPARAGCDESMFFDYIHYTNDCLKAVFSGIPATRF